MSEEPNGPQDPQPEEPTPPEPDDVPDPGAPVEPKLGIAEYLGVKALDVPTRAALMSYLKHTQQDVYGTYTKAEWDDYYKDMMEYT